MSMEESYVYEKQDAKTLLKKRDDESKKIIAKLNNLKNIDVEHDHFDSYSQKIMLRRGPLVLRLKYCTYNFWNIELNEGEVRSQELYQDFKDCFPESYIAEQMILIHWPSKNVKEVHALTKGLIDVNLECVSPTTKAFFWDIQGALNRIRNRKQRDVRFRKRELIFLDDCGPEFIEVNASNIDSHLHRYKIEGDLKKIKRFKERLDQRLLALAAVLDIYDSRFPCLGIDNADGGYEEYYSVDQERWLEGQTISVLLLSVQKGRSVLMEQRIGFRASIVIDMEDSMDEMKDKASKHVRGMIQEAKKERFKNRLQDGR